MPAWPRQFLAAHEVTLVPSLSQARQGLKSWSFHAILLDFDLEDGKGSELLAEVQVLAPRPLRRRGFLA